MILIQSILLILVGIVGVLWGADCFTDNAARMARRLKISQMVIGLTVVAFGTSAPEFFVSLASAVKGTSSMALGNVIGSNIFNILIILRKFFEKSRKKNVFQKKIRLTSTKNE